MSEAKFTKGPWVARTDEYEGIKTAVVYLGNDGGFDLSRAPDCIANAKLIAKAPEMYEMLKLLTEMSSEDAKLYLENTSDIVDLLKQVRGE